MKYERGPPHKIGARMALRVDGLHDRHDELHDLNTENLQESLDNLVRRHRRATATEA
jgi:hypothetical protein